MRLPRSQRRIFIKKAHEKTWPSAWGFQQNRAYLQEKYPAKYRERKTKNETNILSSQREIRI